MAALTTSMRLSFVFFCGGHRCEGLFLFLFITVLFVLCDFLFSCVFVWWCENGDAFFPSFSRSCFLFERNAHRHCCRTSCNSATSAGHGRRNRRSDGQYAFFFSLVFWGGGHHARMVMRGPVSLSVHLCSVLFVLCDFHRQRGCTCSFSAT